MVRPILHYVAETVTSKQLAETVEMRIIRAISELSLLDQVRSNGIRQKCGIQNVVTRTKRRGWNSHAIGWKRDGLLSFVKMDHPWGQRTP